MLLKIFLSGILLSVLGLIFYGTPSEHYLFTGKERDAEGGLDNFGARYNQAPWEGS